MKPRNSYERQIVALSAKLPNLTDAQIRWGTRHCFNDKIYRTGKEIGWCSHCGKDVKIDTDAEVMKCPHCGKSLKVEIAKKRVFRGKSYLTILTTVKGFQVCRHFSIEKYMKRGGTAEYEVFECVQNWINEKGKETVIARKTIPFTMYYDVWDRNSEMSIKNGNYPLYYHTQNRYDIDGWIYPRMRVLPKLMRNGFDKSKLDECLAVNKLMVMLLTDREAEMLMKQGQLALLEYKWRRGIGEFGLPIEAIKVASRHGYIVKDASMWLDHIDLLNIFGKDIHNPHYVCPENLEAEHSALTARKARLDAREKMKKDMEAAAMWEEQYRKDKSPYLGICFGNEHVVITVIQSVREMAEEGSVMHHCVYANGYYKKTDSLILTAKDINGNRVETIEISLKTFEVIQSRGKMNQNTEFHDEIVNLVRSNIGLFKNPGKNKKAA